MTRLRARWAAMGERSQLVVAGGAAALVVAITAASLALLVGALGPRSSAIPTPSAPPPPSPIPTSLPTPTPTPWPTPSPSPSPTGPDLAGTDGRLTILLLGSDFRPSKPGNRTDAIMVVSVDSITGQTAVVSIPRDTARFPLPDGGVFAPKVNALYQQYVAEMGQPAAGAEIKRTMSAALGVEIDWYAVIGFAGVRRLVDAVGGVDIVLERAVSDPFYWVTSKQRGIFFPAGANHLTGERALIFVRTRQGDNDYERARRQQLLVAAAVAEVKAAGLADLARLVGVGSDWVRTDLPLDEIHEIFRIVALADLETDQRAVLGPRTYADGIPGTSSIQLKLDVVRALIAKWMPPVERAAPTAVPSAPDPRPSGTVPVPSESVPASLMLAP